ncbi:hypothetical protein NPIL_363491 [Nephila pilipes]|uniref:Uncharacterized protein n=1 Tax=Nephila pilipes TaxID=299642 RepID=A0A8X6TK09_NEPPI|nr:hypothetical protein NPIL_363491 [Nephila pilipes]
MAMNFNEQQDMEHSDDSRCSTPSQSEDTRIHCHRRRKIEHRVRCAVQPKEHYRDQLALMKTLPGNSENHEFKVIWNLFTNKEQILHQPEGRTGNHIPKSSGKGSRDNVRVANRRFKVRSETKSLWEEFRT